MIVNAMFDQNETPYILSTVSITLPPLPHSSNRSRGRVKGFLTSCLTPTVLQQKNHMIRVFEINFSSEERQPAE